MLGSLISPAKSGFCAPRATVTRVAKLHNKHQCARCEAAAPPPGAHSSGHSSGQSRSGAQTLIKICGITTLQDAELAAAAGADLIGMIILSAGGWTGCS
ncbi:hypothetical protein WJX72_007026 [[Myrmecia] bisecta]|uniref:Phosphoribosylanthranilate isomerase n=1 Tax=[Myrmecia] bisecta TaxID=41462 RepID=A0AAW1PLB2_9CHLO